MPQTLAKSGTPWDYITSIHLDSVSKSYNGAYAVRDLSLTIKGGELIALIGGSGSGKTTTLRMINRMVEPDAGTIRINEIPVSSFHLRSLRRSIGYVIQQIGLLPHLSVSDNIGLPLRIAGVHRDEIHRRVQALLSLVRLDPVVFQNRKPAELSGGQQQRIGLARALITEPTLLLMDEPFGALDPLLRRELQHEFLELKKDLGITIIFVTHDIHEAFLLGDRIALLHEGRLHAVGTVSELILATQDDPILSYFIGDDRMPYIGTVPAWNISLPVGSFQIRRPEPGQPEKEAESSEVKVIIHCPENQQMYATFPGKTAKTMPVLSFTHDTSVLEALSAFTKSGSNVAVIETAESPGSPFAVILQDSLLRYLFGHPS